MDVGGGAAVVGGAAEEMGGSAMLSVVSGSLSLRKKVAIQIVTCKFIYIAANFIYCYFHDHIAHDFAYHHRTSHSHSKDRHRFHPSGPDRRSPHRRAVHSSLLTSLKLDFL